MISRIQNCLRRTIILLEFQYFRPRIISLKINNILYIGAPPRVNTLVHIADHAKILLGADQHLSQNVLRVVGILIFIDQNITKAVLIRLAHIRMTLQNNRRQQQQIIEIQRIVGLQNRFIAGVNFSGFFRKEIVRRLLRRPRILQIIFRIGNARLQRIRRKLLIVEVHLF